MEKKEINNSNKTESIINKIDFKEEIPSDVLENLEGISEGKNGLLMLKGPNIGGKIMLEKDSYTIGRDHNVEIFLDDITISRRHAIIERVDEFFRLTDLGSLNGSYVNDESIESVILKNGDKIQIGKYVFLFFSL
jgi:pSer/pThr/pTyr-binding forkhead associated (FHA) protein